MVGFLKLPPEIRIDIYRLIFAPECPDLPNIRIQDLHPEDYNTVIHNGRNNRTSYKARDHPVHACPRYFETDLSFQPCTFPEPEWMNAKTTYTVHRYSFQGGLNQALLAVYRQIRTETNSLFYGENTFSFLSISALVPSLRDRPDDALRVIRSLRLNFNIERDSQADRQQSWAQAFSGIPRYPTFDVKKLEVFLSDSELCYARDLKLSSRLMRWAHVLSKNITNLEVLGVQINYLSDGDTYSDYEGQTMIGSSSQQSLWAFLAPKMLKHIDGEQRDAKSLKKRRICRNTNGWDPNWDPVSGQSL